MNSIFPVYQESGTMEICDILGKPFPFPPQFLSVKFQPGWQGSLKNAQLCHLAGQNWAEHKKFHTPEVVRESKDHRRKHQIILILAWNPHFRGQYNRPSRKLKMTHRGMSEAPWTTPNKAERERLVERDLGKIQLISDVLKEGEHGYAMWGSHTEKKK